MTNRPLNFLLLSIDALRPDHLGCYGYHRKTDEALVPFLDHAAVFKNAYTYSVPTMRAFPVIHSSIWPELCISEVPWQYVKQITLPKFSRTLGEVFKDHNYYCCAHTAWTNFLTDKQGYGRGMDDFVGMLRQDQTPPQNLPQKLMSLLWRSFIFSLRYSPSKWMVHRMEETFHYLRETLNSVTGSEIEEAGGMSGRSGEAVTNYLLDRLSDHHEQPFFLWGHFLDAHPPLSPPKEFSYEKNVSATMKREIQSAFFKRRPLSPKLKEAMVDLYDGEIRGVFHQVRRIFDALKAHDQLSNTCVMITSDHGFAFWEHDYWEYPDDKFYNESLRIPLLVFHPSITKSHTSIEAPVSLMDLAPTALELCGLPAEPRFFGRSFSHLLTAPQDPDLNPSIWFETMGPPKRSCYLRAGKKIIFDPQSDHIFQYLNGRDETELLAHDQEQQFRHDLKAYEARKQTFLTRILPR